uniref:Uncharacterized protein n=1 Tax=Romanomermis culicivorax TaxID=13658 RepID=A0A915IEI5_ROMCU
MENKEARKAKTGENYQNKEKKSLNFTFNKEPSKTDGPKPPLHVKSTICCPPGTDDDDPSTNKLPPDW